MKKWTLVFFLFVFLLSSNSKAQNPVSFFAEYIDFILDSQYFSINGIYSFRNNSGKIVNQQILFPFAVKTTLIDTIRVTDLNSQQMLNFIVMDSAILFTLKILPKDSTDINIFYRQKSSAKNTYIITTTQMWGQPLEKAIYTLTTQKDLAINSFSYNPDSMKISDSNKKIYLWKKYHFSPQLNFDILMKK